MSSEDIEKANSQMETVDEPKSPSEIPPPTEPRKRPRLDVSALTGGRDRKRGKTMFGILVGTLEKAKHEDKERNASEAAKKRHLIEQRLQAKLKKETDSVRRAEEAKKDKTSANRKEEDLQLKDSVYKLRRTRLNLLSNFLLTSDVIPIDDSTTPLDNPLAPPPRSHPPPLFFLPAVLTPTQEAFLARRKTEVAEATEKEWNLFEEERKTGIDDIEKLRIKVAEEDARRKLRDSAETAEVNADAAISVDDAKGGEVEMDDGTANKTPLPVVKEDVTIMQADDEDAVEY